MALEVIIPVKDRPEVEQCVQSLLAIAAISRIWVCDGGSQQSDCVTALSRITQDERVQWLQIPTLGFNKSYLMNQGILHTVGQYVLISDADILWDTQTIQSLLQRVAENEKLICSIREVQESNPLTTSLRRNRYTYQIRMNSDTIQIEILPVDSLCKTVRPGCGLICTQRRNLLTLGGYQERFQGWGWEDQDLLMRATILGLELEVAGSVVHLSHGDDQRNLHFHQMEPVKSRDRNILTCLNQLAQGKLLGDLPIISTPPFDHRAIEIYIPSSLSC